VHKAHARRLIMAAITITKENFESEVLKSDKPVLVDFWAPWCGPCRMVSPIVDEIADEVTTAKVGKINVDEQEELAMQFGVMSIPTLIVFKNGKVDKQAVGGRPKADIVAMLN
jgi:thioredoxin 1